LPIGYRVIDASGIVLAHVYGQPDGAIAVSDARLTQDEACRISKLISRLPDLLELERDRNRARSRRKPQPLRSKPVTIGDLIRDGKLLEVHCGNCRPARHLYIDAESLDLPKRLSVPEVASHLVCSVCGAKNSDTYHPDLGEARCAGGRRNRPISGLQQALMTIFSAVMFINDRPKCISYTRAALRRGRGEGPGRFPISWGIFFQ
jgi:hypothetical protein